MTGDGARAYTYDAENRIVSVSGLSSEGYGYDAGSRRVKKETGGVVTHYIWEGGQVIAEYEHGGGATQATGTRYYHQDRLSTRVITDGAGTVVGTTDQLPFGEEIGVSSESEKHKFTTYERDGTGLDYAVNRYYASQQGRFNRVDPLGMAASSLADPQSLNLYSNVHNDPVNFVDPTGLQEIPIIVPDVPSGFTVTTTSVAIKGGGGGMTAGQRSLLNLMFPGGRIGGGGSVGVNDGGLSQSQQSQIPTVKTNLPGIRPDKATTEQAPRCNPGGNSGDSSFGGDGPAVGRASPSKGTGPRVSGTGNGARIGPGAAGLAGVLVLALLYLWKTTENPYPPKPSPCSTPEAREPEDPKKSGKTRCRFTGYSPDGKFCNYICTAPSGATYTVQNWRVAGCPFEYFL